MMRRYKKASNQNNLSRPSAKGEQSANCLSILAGVSVLRMHPAQVSKNKDRKFFKSIKK